MNDELYTDLEIKQLKLWVEMLKSVKPTRKLPDRINILVDDEQVVDLFNSQSAIIADLKKENEQLKKDVEYWKQEELISEQAIQLDYLKDENRHMSEVLDENKQLKQQEEKITFLKSSNMELEDANARLEEKNIELQERNDRQYDKLTHLWGCIRNKDYETLQKELEEIEEANKKLQEEWKCYNDE